VSAGAGERSASAFWCRNRHSRERFPRAAFFHNGTVCRVAEPARNGSAQGVD